MAGINDAGRALSTAGVRSIERLPPECAISLRGYSEHLAIVVGAMVELEHVEKIAEGRAIRRHIRIVVVLRRIRKIIPAPTGQRLQMPVSLDELQNRDVVCICMVNVPALGERRHNDQRDARPIAEEVQRLDIAGVIVTTAFIEGDDESGVGEEFGSGHEVIDGLLDHAFQEAELRGRRVTVEQAVRLDEGNGRQGRGVDSFEEIRRILDVSCTLRSVAHDGVGEGLEVADVAVGCANQYGWIWAGRIVLESNSGVIGSAVVGPGNALFVKRFADGAGIYL